MVASVDGIVEQLTSRDAALLTWIGVGILLTVWSMIRGGEVGQSVVHRRPRGGASVRGELADLSVSR
jgi:hypothetical protein